MPRYAAAATKARRTPKRWTQAAKIKRGALHRQLGVPEGTKIPIAVLRWAASQPGILGKRARLALTFRQLRTRKKRYR